jgi:predicted phosphodiesterase
MNYVKKTKLPGNYKTVLCISDTHCPYQHPDTVAFLKAVAKKYRPDLVVHLGDEVDAHAMSFHDSDPDLPSAGDELKQAIKALKPLYKLFPKMLLLDSNHGSMVYRKGKHHGISAKYLREYGDVLEAPKGWRWCLDLTINAGGKPVYFHHGKESNVLAVSQKMGYSVVQGHYHNEYGIRYWGNPSGLRWGMQIGCSIDDESMAFAYNKITTKRPIIGHAIILEGLPKLLPMVLTSSGRWNKIVP